MELSVAVYHVRTRNFLRRNAWGHTHGDPQGSIKYLNASLDSDDSSPH